MHEHHYRTPINKRTRHVARRTRAVRTYVRGQATTDVYMLCNDGRGSGCQFTVVVILIVSTHRGPRVQELAKPWQSCGVRVRAWAHASVALATTIVWLAWAHVSRFDRSPLPPAPFHTTSCLKIAGYLGSCALYCTTGVPLH